MIRKLFYIFGFTIVFTNGYSQEELKTRPMPDMIILPEYSPGSKLFLIHQDSIFQVFAPGDSIDHFLKPLRQNDPLCVAFKELTSTRSTNFFLKMKEKGLVLDSGFLIHHMLKEGSCEVINRKTGKKAKSITVNIYAWAEFSPKGIQYYVDNLLLYDYFNLID